MLTPNAKTAQPAGENAATQSTTPETLGWQLRAALPPLRLHSVSLCDAEGEVLWLSEGALGPDEHGFVIQAINALTQDTSLASCESDLEDGRFGVFLPVRAPQGELVGLAMILADSKGLGDGLAARVLTPPVRSILQKVAIHLRPQSALGLLPPSPAPAAATSPVSKAAAPVMAKPAVAPKREPPEKQPDSARTNDLLAPLAMDDILSFELVDDGSPIPSTADDSASAWPAIEEGALSDPFNVGELSLLDNETIVTAVRAPQKPEDADAQLPEPPPARIVPPPALEPPARAAKAANTPSRPVTPLSRAVPAQAAQAPIAPIAKELPASSAEPKRKDAPPRPGALTDPAFKDLVLSVQMLSKLRPGGRTKRYEVLVRTRHDPTALDAAEQILRTVGDQADLDSFVVSRLFTWLAEHPVPSERETLTFTINLSARALQDERFPEHVASWLRRTGVAAERLGFELAQSLCVQYKPQVERFIVACEKMGCFFVLDDFTMDTRIVDLMRSKALRLIKIDAKLTGEAMKDKLSQALVIGISQAAKVLGVHCAAKKIETQMVRRWITAIGFDFAQGSLFEGPRPIEALLTPPAPDAS